MSADCRQLWLWAGLSVMLGAGLAQAQGPGRAIDIPAAATALDGVPQVSVDITKDGAQRRELEPADASKHRLMIRVTDGRFFWASHDDRPLTLTAAGDFIYLTPAEPGRYLRLRRLNDTFTYVEHVDTAFGSVTYWGELRIVLGK